MQVQNSTLQPPYVYFGENAPDHYPPPTASRLRSLAPEQRAGDKQSGDDRIIILLAEDNLADAYLVEEALANKTSPALFTTSKMASRPSSSLSGPKPMRRRLARVFFYWIRIFRNAAASKYSRECGKAQSVEISQ
jgi:hypothetical protein